MTGLLACIAALALGPSFKAADFRIRDPFVLVDGGRYYLYESHFDGLTAGGERGVFVRTSADLENWSGPSPVMVLPDGMDCTAIWAPEVHRHYGAYWLFVTLTQSTNAFQVASMSEEVDPRRLRPRGTHVFKGASPRGPFRPVREGPVPPRADSRPVWLIGLSFDSKTRHLVDFAAERA